MFVKLSNFGNFCKQNSESKKRNLFQRIFYINTIISIIILGIVTAIILTISLVHTKTILISNCQNMATSLAENYIIYDALVSKHATERLLTYLDNILKNSSSIDSITIMDNNRVCLYHYDHAVTGTEIPLIPPKTTQIQTMRFSIGTDENGKPIRELSALVPILNARGKVFGYVIVGIFESTLQKLNRTYGIRYLLIVSVAIGTAYIASYLAASNIRTSLMGYEPESITGLLIKRNEVLDNLEEGLIAIDKTQHISVVTKPALTLFNLPQKEYEGTPIDELNLDMNFSSVLTTGKAKYNIQKTAGQRTVLTDIVPMKEHDAIIGAVAIIRDHTAYTNMAEELTGFRFVVEALRSNMHNFKNELHVLLGMLQLNEVQLAINYITRFNSVQVSQSAVLKNIQNKTIAGLILGKTNEAKEQGVNLCLEEGSLLQRHNPYLTINQLTIILGNLLENAIEATKAKESGGEINLYIKSDNTNLKINIDDNGCGIPLEIQNHLFERGVTSKHTDTQNHGIGLFSIHEIITERSGIIQIDSLPGEGTSVSIQISKRRQGYEKMVVEQEVEA